MSGRRAAAALRAGIRTYVPIRVPLEVVRKGRTLRIVADQRPSKLARLKKRSCIVGDSEEIRKIDWLRQWGPKL
jgi:hypothetical protein